MTNSALKGRADDPRACRGVIRATFLTFPMVIFLTLALAPLNANVDNSGIVSVQRCEAYADAEPNANAYDFLVTLASAMDMTVNETIATVTGITAGATGMVIANDDGVSFHGQNNLDHLADAADYPSWESLDQTQQQGWVSKDNYDSAKFNSLMDAYGLGDARDRFYANSGSFDFDDTENQRIDRLGRIGNLWMNKIGVAAGDLKETILDLQSISKYFPSQGGTSDKVFDGTNVEGWPVELPSQVAYAYPTTECGITYNGGTWYGLYDCSVACYSVLWVNGTTVRWDMFSTEPFTVQYGIKPSRYLASSYQGTYDDKPVYYYTASISLRRLEGSDTNPINEVNGTAINIDTSKRINYMGAILYGESGGSSAGEAPTVPDYPEEIPDDEDVYYPTEGITPETTWPVYIEVQRPDNIYNPDDKTQGEEWKQETKQNVLPLQNIRFDKLFPFCLMTDVKDLTEKIEDTITPGQQSNYLKIKVPMAYASDGQGQSVSEEIELDGTPVRDLLVMVRPFNQVLLLFLMVFSLVMFWKSILTGD